MQKDHETLTVRQNKRPEIGELYSIWRSMDDRQSITQCYVRHLLRILLKWVRTEVIFFVEGVGTPRLTVFGTYFIVI